MTRQRVGLQKDVAAIFMGADMPEEARKGRRRRLREPIRPVKHSFSAGHEASARRSPEPSFHAEVTSGQAAGPLKSHWFTEPISLIRGLLRYIIGRKRPQPCTPGQRGHLLVR